MLIRLLPLAIAAVVATVAIAGATALAVALLPILMKASLGAKHMMPGAWVAIAAGMVTALALAQYRDRKHEAVSSNEPDASGPKKSLERSRDR